MACDADGDFVVTWTNTTTATRIFTSAASTPTALLKGVYFNTRHQHLPAGGRYRRARSSYGDAVRVNNFTAGNQKWSNVAMDSRGDFVVTWSSYGQEQNATPGLGYGVYAQKYDSAGSVVTPEFQVNINTGGDQFHSNVVLTDDGWFVVTWEARLRTAVSNNHQILARVFDPSNSMTPAEVIVDKDSPPTTSIPISPAIPAAIRSSSPGKPCRTTGTAGKSRRRADYASIRRTPALDPWAAGLWATKFAVNTTTAGDQKYSSVAMDANGNFVVAWSGFGNQTGPERPLRRRRVLPTLRLHHGARKSARKPASTRTPPAINTFPRSSSDADGNVVIAFTGVDADVPATRDLQNLHGASPRRKPTTSGRRSPTCSSRRPMAPIIAATRRLRVARRRAGIRKSSSIFSEDMYLATGLSGN